MKPYRIYTRWLAYELRKQKFKIIGTDVNEFHPEYTVWLFENDDRLQAAITELTNKHKKK